MSRSHPDIRPHEPDLPPVDEIHHRGRLTSFFSSIFGGSHIERRPLPILFVVLGITFLGFVVGTLFTMGILSGVIEIDPKAIKSFFKALMGKA